VVANGADSTQIYITVQDSTGGLIADGTSIFLEHTGTGFLSPTQTMTTDGQALSVLRAPANIVGSPNIDSVFIWGNANDTTVVADTVVITYVPGPVNELAFIRPDSTVTLIAGSGAIDTVQVAAIDANGNPVANGTMINFINEIATSSLTPSSAPTQNGIATSIYLVGSETGDDNVRAFVPHPDNPSDTIWTVQPVVYRCLSAEATTLELSASQSRAVSRSGAIPVRLLLRFRTLSVTRYPKGMLLPSGLWWLPVRSELRKGLHLILNREYMMIRLKPI
jgi:hypothetical protein